MKILVTAAALLAGQFLIAGSPACAQQQVILLTPAQSKVYHECLTAQWVEDYCRDHSWGIFATFDRTKAECVAAENGGIYPVNGRRFFENTEGYCWAQAHAQVR
jgi:hypothetical protein